MFQHMCSNRNPVLLGEKSSNPRGCEQNIRIVLEAPIAAGSPEHRQRLKDTGGAGTHSRKTYRYEPQELTDSPTRQPPGAHAKRVSAQRPTQNLRSQKRPDPCSTGRATAEFRYPYCTVQSRPGVTAAPVSLTVQVQTVTSSYSGAATASSRACHLTLLC